MLGIGNASIPIQRISSFTADECESDSDCFGNTKCIEGTCSTQNRSPIMRRQLNQTIADPGKKKEKTSRLRHMFGMLGIGNGQTPVSKITPKTSYATDPGCPSGQVYCGSSPNENDPICCDPMTAAMLGISPWSRIPGTTKKQRRFLRRNPQVGGDIDNLTLSDQRAQASTGIHPACLANINGQWMMLHWSTADQQNPHQWPVTLVSCQPSGTPCHVTAPPSQQVPEGINRWLPRCPEFDVGTFGSLQMGSFTGTQGPTLGFPSGLSNTFGAYTGGVSVTGRTSAAPSSSPLSPTIGGPIGGVTVRSANPWSRIPDTTKKQRRMMKRSNPCGCIGNNNAV